MRPASRARRALFELARLHGVQTSFTAADGSRRSAGDEPVLAVLAALGVPLSGCFDAPEALRAEHNVRATQLIEPVLVSRTGARSRHCLRPPPRFEPDSAWIEVAAEDGSVTRRRLGQVLGPASSFAHQREPGGYLELRLGPDLCPHDGYYRLRVETTTSIAEALVISAPPRCPQPSSGWGVFAPVHALSSRGDWGIGTFHDLGALGSVVQRLGGSFVA
ncbi:MAG: hypothetical protein ACRDZ5_10670, partial [Acidimicrobiales bacterium]